MARSSMANRPNNMIGNPAQQDEKARVSRIVSIELAGVDLAAVEAWRHANRAPSLEAAVEELLRRALMDEISGIEDLLRQVRTRLGLDNANNESGA